MANVGGPRGRASGVGWGGYMLPVPPGSPVQAGLNQVSLESLIIGTYMGHSPWDSGGSCLGGTGIQTERRVAGFGSVPQVLALQWGR